MSSLIGPRCGGMLGLVLLIGVEILHTPVFGLEVTLDY